MALRIEPHAEILPGYKLLERLGGGGFGEVWKCIAPGGFHKAVKVIYGDLRDHVGSHADEKRQAEQELRAVQRILKIRHPFLLSLERYDVVQGRLVIVMELADRNLWERFRECVQQGLRGIPREELLRYMVETAEVLDMMNEEHQVQHLDVKPQNLFLVHNHVKVGDFGLVKDLEGVSAVITGGVTPVYAAPETFDGNISRFCDQYSLAIVYQELLTGERPFKGTAIKQLLTQHMEAPPNLESLPEQDRPAVARALAKRSRDRFRSCREFVSALADVSAATSSSGARKTAVITRPPRLTPSTADTPGRQARTGRTPVPGRSSDSSGSIDFSRQPRSAPEARTGAGVLMPAVVMGLGRAGVEVVARLRAQLRAKFNSPDRVACLKLLAVDTDLQTLRPLSKRDFAGSLPPECVVDARLNRTGHYLQPRGGRLLIDGWLEPHLLHRIPRQQPNTTGVRALGRLAFCDHVRPVTHALGRAIHEVSDPKAMERAERETGLGLRSNRPRVYVVAHLAGGTGGGMFLDAAYAARHRLDQLGYPDGEVHAILIAPRADADAQELANAYASVAELAHFTRPGSQFRGEYEDGDASTKDDRAPFDRCIILGTPGDDEVQLTGLMPALVPLQLAADHLRRELTTHFGRRCDDERERFSSWMEPPPVPGEVCLTTFGAEAYSWPRAEALAKAAQQLSLNLLRSWLAFDDREDGGRFYVAAQQIWDDHRLGEQAFRDRLHGAVCDVAGGDPSQTFQDEAAEFVPAGSKSMFGLFQRGPDPSKVWEALERLQRLVGLPESVGVQSRTGDLERHVAEAGGWVEQELGDPLLSQLTDLIDAPGMRLVGADRVCQAVRSGLTESLEHNEARWRESARLAGEAFLIANSVLSPDKGRRRSTAEIAAALENFGNYRYESLLLREMCRVCNRLRGRIDELLRDIEVCRRQLARAGDCLERRLPVSGEAAEADLLPEGCTSLEDVAERLVGSLSDEDRLVLDRQAGDGICTEFDSLYRACVNSLERQEELAQIFYERSLKFLDKRLGDADVVDMFFRRYGNADQSVAMIQRAYQSASPALTGDRDGGEICVLGLPPGDRGEPFQLLAQRALGYVDVTLVTHPDEILLYREAPYLALDELPVYGGDAAEAYQMALDTEHYTPHTRTDIEDWFSVEAK